ncbi:Fis family sigma54 specific transcriptional regulator [Plasticicumulans lactativorans]|uniref:Fis family sigma54 specific transcriptional regulator n=1 Tax=Plasticicumulans lactativorans TaxID=1133106 RepID=A0A4R2LFG4_9GAMM|nr:sigma 54-interacting transcriptional regulator [Plasticicumulans lactativorans]TCO83424.1 Fis family sigma54 specific transcriptional regulator [Plasticicumulans lactativorans]
MAQAHRLPSFLDHAESIRRQAAQYLFDYFESSCEGAMAVDGEARIVWMNEQYAQFLGLPDAEWALGRPVEEVIPQSLMREVVETGEPILLDIMQHGEHSPVVTRLPLRDAGGRVIGAVGFVLFDDPRSLQPVMTKFTRLRAELDAARRELSESRRARYRFEDFVGVSAAATEVKRQARRIAQGGATVLLLGETGTGKELVAQAIHAASARAGHPFVGMNVAAVPEGLLEAEFFGVAPGAYTGADRRGRDGKFKLAEGGTLFLDEVGDMPLHLQAKLLRVLQEQEFEPVGSNRVQRVDVRVIAATSRDLPAMVADGRFRADLYFRLNVLPITLPPLRTRREDLPALADALLARIGERNGGPRRSIAASALEVLAAYDWPGNVRELANVLERATMLSDRRRLEAVDFAGILAGAGPAARPPAAPAAAPAPAGAGPLAAAVAAAERDAIRAALAAAGGRKVEAARILGISRATLYEKLAQFDAGDPV